MSNFAKSPSPSIVSLSGLSESLTSSMLLFPSKQTVLSCIVIAVAFFILDLNHGKIYKKWSNASCWNFILSTFEIVKNETLYFFSFHFLASVSECNRNDLKVNTYEIHHMSYNPICDAYFAPNYVYIFQQFGPNSITSQLQG